MKSDSAFNDLFKNKQIIKISEYAYKYLLYSLHLNKLEPYIHIFLYHFSYEFNADRGKADINQGLCMWDLPYPDLAKINSSPIDLKRLIIPPEMYGPNKEQNDLGINSKIPLPSLKGHQAISIQIQMCARQKLGFSSLPNNSLYLPSILVNTVIAEPNLVRCTDISKDGKVIAIGMSDSVIKAFILDPSYPFDITNLDTGQVETKDINKPKVDENVFIAKAKKLQNGEGFTLVGHSEEVTCLSISPSSYFLVSASLDSAIRLWCIPNQTTLVIYKCLFGPQYCIKFAKLGHYFASCGESNMVHIWRTNNVKPVRIMIGHISTVYTIEYFPNMQYIASGSEDKKIIIWNVEKAEPSRILLSPEGVCLVIKVFNDNKYLIAGLSTSQIVIYDIENASLIRNLKIDSLGMMIDFDLCLDDKILALSTTGKSLCLFDIPKLLKINDSNQDEMIKKYRLKEIKGARVCFTYTNLIMLVGLISKSE